jgi:hypothetical protein
MSAYRIFSAALVRLAIAASLFSGAAFVAGSAKAETFTFNIQKNVGETLDLVFYSRDRNHAWPGGTEVYILENNRPYNVTLSCQRGEKICYGAWVRGNTNYFWGVGYGGGQACNNCCFFCDGGQSVLINLNR